MLRGCAAFKRLLGCALLAGLAVGCGGSSSETPPPLEPLPKPSASSAAVPAKHHVVQKGEPLGAGGASSAPAPQQPSPDTWGGGAGAPGRQER